MLVATGSGRIKHQRERRRRRRDVVDVDGNPYKGWLGFYPSAAVVEVVHNDHVVLSGAGCD